jgi:Rho termination factor, N-terminal domain
LRSDDGNKAVVTQRDDIKSSDYATTLKILRRDDSKKVVAHINFGKLLMDNGENAAATPRCGIKKSSRLPSNFDKLIRDHGDNAVGLPPDYKPPRPTSRFVRRSPIPISNPAQEEDNTILRKHPPSVNVGEPLEEMSVSDKLQATIDKLRPPIPEMKRDIPEILKRKETPKFRIGGGGTAKAEPEPKPKEAVTTYEFRDIPKAEPQSETNSELEPNLELEAMTLSELKDIAKAQGLKGYSKLKKAKLLEILKGTPPDLIIT